MPIAFELVLHLKCMQRKIIYLINPISGTRGKASLHQIVSDATRKQKIPFQVLPTVASGDYRFIRQKIEEESISDIVICGGDGTINQVVQELKDEKVNFGIIPMGSGNGLAFAAKIPKSPVKALDIIFNGRAGFIDAFSVNGQFACMLCGLGFDAQVAHDFSKQRTRGLLTYTTQAIKNYFIADPYPFSIVAGETVISTNAFFISIANSNQFGNQFTIAPGASLSDGMLDIVVVPQMNKAVLALAILQQVKSGKPTEKISKSTGNKIFYFQADQLRIKNPERAPMHIDGEPKETLTSLDIRVIPRCFKLLQPYA